MLTINIINKSSNPLPEYQTSGSSAVDLYANNNEPITIKKGEISLIPTGIYISIPKYYEAQIRSRSGLAINHGIFCLNSPGTIDSDYRGEIKVILASFVKDKFIVNCGDRIAQMVFAKVEIVGFNKVDSLDKTSRQAGGFGSSGYV